MIEKTIKIYECEFCKKYYKRKYFCEKHEIRCYNNPNNFHKCYDCIHLEVDRELYDNYFVKTFYCKHKKQYMHTFKAEYMGFAEKLGTIRMPLECDSYECSVNFD